MLNIAKYLQHQLPYFLKWTSGGLFHLNLWSLHWSSNH